jgi:transcriptional regulator with XRE-family HTH domain
MAQAQNSKNADFFSRVEKLKLAKDWTWDEVAKRLHLTRGMLHFIKQGKYGVSKRNLYRLEQLEKEEGMAPAGARQLIEALVSNIESSKVKITPTDFDRGYVEVPVMYARGEPPKGYSKSVELRRPSVKASAKLIADLLVDEDYGAVLLSCIQPKKYANQEFLNLLTPFSYQALIEASMELVFGSEWKRHLNTP